jgi:hypothetical protein
MNLKKTVYKTIEITEDEDYGMVVGNIVMDDGEDSSKMLYAEIVKETICNHEELANMRAFLDEVYKMMPTIYNEED